VQYILNTPDLEGEDLEEWMAEILNTEFDTIFEVRFDVKSSDKDFFSGRHTRINC
jgi:hypothetical protein